VTLDDSKERWCGHCGGEDLLSWQRYHWKREVVRPLEVKQYRWKRRPPINEDTHNEDTHNNQPGTDDDNGG